MVEEVWWQRDIGGKWRRLCLGSGSDGPHYPLYSAVVLRAEEDQTESDLRPKIHDRAAYTCSVVLLFPLD